MDRAQLLELRYHDPQSALAVDLEEIERLGIDTLDGEWYRWSAVNFYGGVGHLEIAETLASMGQMRRMSTWGRIYFLAELISIKLPHTLMSSLVTQAMESLDRTTDIFWQYHEYGCLRAIEMHVTEMGKASPEASVLMDELTKLQLLNRRHLIIQWRISQQWDFEKLGAPANSFFRRIHFGLQVFADPNEEDVEAIQRSGDFLRRITEDIVSSE